MALRVVLLCADGVHNLAVLETVDSIKVSPEAMKSAHARATLKSCLYGAACLCQSLVLAGITYLLRQGTRFTNLAFQMMRRTGNWVKSEKTHDILVLQLANKLDNAVSSLNRQPLAVMIQVSSAP